MYRKTWLNAISKAVTLHQYPRKIVLSGPSGFLGKRVLKSIIELHNFRRDNGLDPGELILLSASPGKFSISPPFDPVCLHYKQFHTHHYYISNLITYLLLYIYTT